jgi:hypothetical protein
MRNTIGWSRSLVSETTTRQVEFLTRSGGQRELMIENSWAKKAPSVPQLQRGDTASHPPSESGLRALSHCRSPRRCRARLAGPHAPPPRFKQKPRAHTRLVQLKHVDDFVHVATGWNLGFMLGQAARHLGSTPSRTTRLHGLRR